MDGRQKPDPQTESGTDLNDKDVIDLTEVVEDGDGYDVIDLNDIIEQPDQAMEAVVEPEEAAPPLVNALPEEETADALEVTDDEIIDLTDLTASPEAPAISPVAESTTASSDDEVEEVVIDLVNVATTTKADLIETDEASEDEDDVIDLMDLAPPPEGDTAETGMTAPDPMPDGTDEMVPADDPVIDLLDAVEPQAAEAGSKSESDDEFTALESRAEAVLTDAGGAFDVETPEEAAETAGPDSDFMAFDDNQSTIGEVGDQGENVPDIPEPVAPPPAAPLFDPVPPPEPVPLTEAQVEAALERTIEKIYGERIEQLLIRTIEKTVTREIVRIKNALLEDDDDMIG
ncbi:hypothetical protein [Desulfosarcina sp.]|uniref:hypothetical protein n=1 Tax=Desulfosarcina sp. TaxID=2027861 RepID=UPI0035657418